MKALQAIGSGLIGALSLTAVHEITRRLIPEAPRMDLLGMRAIEKGLDKLDQPSPKGDTLFRITMLGDIISNALYYSLIGLGEDGKSTWLRGAGLGLAAGVGAVTLPNPLGLGSGPSSRTRATQLLTVLLYLEGGVAAAAAYRLWRKNAG